MVLKVQMATPDPILNYSKPESRPSLVPLYGLFACPILIVCGFGIIAFGAWSIRIACLDPKYDLWVGVLKGAAICFTGCLIGMLAEKWLRAARRARRTALARESVGIFKPETPSALDRTLRKVAFSVGATEAAAFVVHRDRTENALQLALHIRPDNSDSTVRQAAVKSFSDIIRPCITHKKNGVIEIGQSENERGRQFCLVALSRQQSEVLGAIAMIIRRHEQAEAELALGKLKLACDGH